MGDNSNIQWTDHTFNPVRGCVEVSPGCDHCYAATMSKRNPAVLGTWGADGSRIIASAAMWRAPARWNARAMELGARFRVFCASLGDVFEDWRGDMSLPAGPRRIARAFLDVLGEYCWSHEPDPETVWLTYQDVRARLFHLVEATPNLDWQLLTKRPQNVLRMVPPSWRQKFPPNVWMGTTCEDQRRANERIPHLLDIPARIRFLSCEPLLGPISLQAMPLDPDDSLFRYWPLTGAHLRDGMNEQCAHPNAQRIHWVIAGGESGPGFRALDLANLNRLDEQCSAAGVPFFVKQDSAPQPGQQGRIPADLWARKEFPRVERSPAA